MDKTLQSHSTSVASPVQGWAPAPDHRMFVGPPDKYDLVAAMQFNILTLLGLREHHSLLDIGCGSLRAGRLFIPYLLPERYYGLEPEEWLVQEGIKHEIGEDLVRLRKPRFAAGRDFTLTVFERHFDYLLAQSIFSHAAPGQIRRCLSEARRVMEPSSIFAATFFEGAESYTGDEWHYPDSVSYRFEDVRAMAAGAGLAAGRLMWPHPNGQRWAAFFEPGQEERIPLAMREPADFP